MFNQDVQVNYIFNAHKPSIVNYEKAMELMGTDKRNTIFVGDQLFTDVWGAKRTGIRNILVKPIHPKEEIQIVFKRKLEKIVLYFYKRSKK
jgi:HAD superfamily phosphatase (TIGR01668 family)